MREFSNNLPKTIININQSSSITLEWSSAIGFCKILHEKRVHASRDSKFKMASRGRVFTAEEVAEICAWSENEAGSDIDSETRGMSSGEEFELDNQLRQESDSETELR